MRPRGCWPPRPARSTPGCGPRPGRWPPGCPSAVRAPVPPTGRAPAGWSPAASRPVPTSTSTPRSPPAARNPTGGPSTCTPAAGGRPAGRSCCSWTPPGRWPATSSPPPSSPPPLWCSGCARATSWAWSRSGRRRWCSGRCRSIRGSTSSSTGCAICAAGGRPTWSWPCGQRRPRWRARGRPTDRCCCCRTASRPTAPIRSTPPPPWPVSRRGCRCWRSRRRTRRWTPARRSPQPAGGRVAALHRPSQAPAAVRELLG